MIRAALATLALLTATACTSSSTHDSPPPHVSTAAYVHTVQAHTNATDDPASLLRIGHTICRYFHAGGSFTGILAAISRPQGGFSTDDANTVILEAVEYLCPAQKGAFDR